MRASRRALLVSTVFALVAAGCSRRPPAPRTAGPAPSEPLSIQVLTGADGDLRFLLLPVDYGEGDPLFHRREIARLLGERAPADVARIVAVHAGQGDAEPVQLGEVEVEIETGTATVQSRTLLAPADRDRVASTSLPLLDVERWRGLALRPGEAAVALLAFDASLGDGGWRGGKIRRNGRDVALRALELKREELIELLEGPGREALVSRLDAGSGGGREEEREQ